VVAFAHSTSPILSAASSSELLTCDTGHGFPVFVVFKPFLPHLLIYKPSKSFFYLYTLGSKSQNQYKLTNTHEIQA